MHWLKSFLLLYKALLLFGLFTAFVSSCSPETNDRNPISLSLSISVNWRVNVAGFSANPDNKMIVFNSGFRPDINEIFLLRQPAPGVYDFRPFENFYRTVVIEIPAATLTISGANFKLQNSTNGDNQRFTIECDVCNIQTDTEDWMPYHKSCLIKNVKSNFCMEGIDAVNDLNQTECEKAHKWDIFGRISPDATTSSCSTNSPNSNESTSLPSMIKTSDIQLSIGGIVGIVLGSAMVTTLIGLAIGFWFFRRHKQYKEDDKLKENDRVNVQFYNND